MRLKKETGEETVKQKLAMKRMKKMKRWSSFLSTSTTEREARETKAGERDTKTGVMQSSPDDDHHDIRCRRHF